MNSYILSREALEILEFEEVRDRAVFGTNTLVEGWAFGSW
jgi:hypothetical protein